MKQSVLRMLKSEDSVVTTFAIAEIVGRGGYWSRSQIAHELGREKTTYIINRIEMCVRLGLINRLPGYVGKQRGYVYTTEQPMF